jgi:hypothetical protein
MRPRSLRVSARALLAELGWRVVAGERARVGALAAQRARPAPEAACMNATGFDPCMRCGCGMVFAQYVREKKKFKYTVLTFQLLPVGGLDR